MGLRKVLSTKLSYLVHLLSNGLECFTFIGFSIEEALFSSSFERICHFNENTFRIF